MIRFECTSCDQLCKAREDQIGERIRCARCGAVLTVPQPWRSPKETRPPWVLLLLACVVGAVCLGLWATSPTSPDTVRQRLATELQELSGHWKGAQWQKCDPRKDDYKLDVFYSDNQGLHVFEITRLPGTGQTYIVVDPKPEPPRWLAHAVFRHGQQESFEYQGKSEAEREILEELARDLADALRRALR
jgi:hypothetical protein